MCKLKTIYVVFKTHFDIGFTGLASEVIESYRGSMLKSVLETCEATSANPEGHKYVWTMSSWPFKKSLETQDEELQKQALKLVEEGRIVWHALPFTTHTDFSGTEEFIRGLGISAGLARTFGKRQISAKMTDVPGHTRMLPSLLSKAGVKFLHLGCNSCVNPPEVPQSFFWKGPDGNGVVTFYTKGGYGTELLPPDGWEYPVWLALMNTNDNQGPHSVEVICDIVKNVAEKLPETRVVIGSLDDFAEAFLACNPVLPVVDTDLADSWIHGVGTYPAEVSRVRYLRRALMNVEGVLSLKGIYEGHPEADSTGKLLDTAFENLLLFDEHTWGLDTKITLLSLRNGHRMYEKKVFLEDKKSEAYKRLETSWAEKAGYVRKAEDAVNEILNGFPAVKGNKVAVYNLLSWERDGEVDVTGLASTGQVFMDDKSKANPVYEQAGKYKVQLENLPPMGCRVYSIEKMEYECMQQGFIASQTNSGGAILENSRIFVAIDGITGNISSFYDKTNDKEWAVSGGNFGGYTYDIHGKERIIRYLKDYAFDFEDWYLADNGRPFYPRVEDKTYTAEACNVEVRNSCGSGTVRVTWKMPVESILEYGNAPEVVMSVTLKEDSGFVDISYDIKAKEETPFVESGHFVFSLNAEAPKYSIQKMGMAFDPATDIQYGANTSIYCCDKWMNISDGRHGIAFLPKDTPLLSIGENRIYVYSKDYKPQKPVLYWNAFNNQWGTNFPQWIGGDFRYEFRIYPYSGTWSDGGIPKMAEEYVTPLCLLKDDGEYQLLNENIENATVLCFKNADYGNGYILRLQENRGKAGEIRIKLTGEQEIYARCNLLEEDIEEYGEGRREAIIKTAPFEVHTFRISKRYK